MNKTLEKFDRSAISVIRKYGDEFARFALFIIFFWFGILKVLDLSPAGDLVQTLLDNTFLGFLGAKSFMVGFGIFEALLGVMILFPKLERITFALLGFHLITTVMPLFILPEITWNGIMAPTLTGQYIIKNAALLSVGFLLFGRLEPMTKTHSIIGKERKNA